MLKDLFYIIIYNLRSNYFHELEHESLNVSIIIININYSTNFYIQNIINLLVG